MNSSRRYRSGIEATSNGNGGLQAMANDLRRRTKKEVRKMTQDEQEYTSALERLEEFRRRYEAGEAYDSEEYKAAAEQVRAAYRRVYGIGSDKEKELT